MSTSELQPAHSTETLERIQELVRELLGNDAIVLTAETTPAEVEGWDSLANISIIFALEEEFDLQLDDELSTGFKTVGELAQLLDRTRSI